MIDSIANAVYVPNGNIYLLKSKSIPVADIEPIIFTSPLNVTDVELKSIPWYPFIIKFVLSLYILLFVLFIPKFKWL